jgi:aspartate ammonia-lyase
VIASRMFDSMNMLTSGSRIFADRCVLGIKAMREQALENLLGSSALATAFVPKLGYSKVSEIVKKAEAENQLFVDAIVDLGLLTRDQVIDALYASTKCRDLQ